MEIYAQTPHSQSTDNFEDYISRLTTLAEKYGYRGVLVTYSTTSLNPWIIINFIINSSKDIELLIAVQPETLPASTLANLIQSVEVLYKRKVAINVIHGTAKRLEENIEVVKQTNRYAWLKDYINSIKENLYNNQPSYDFSNFQNHSFKTERITAEFFISGTSLDGFKTTTEAAADAYLTIPKPIDLFKNEYKNLVISSMGVCFGIIARSTSQEAWEIARSLYPTNRKNEVELLMKKNSKMNSVSFLADLALEHEVYDKVYWLGVFKSGKNIYPYLVGDYDEVACYLNEYKKLGVNKIILNTPFTEEEFIHRNEVFEKLKKL
ncbi:LLM class flavin-dependent oxidoreductase [Paenibacillus sp. FSL M8-0212]|uniref:LLM class flavin-dependent oxidoreductase n=1 Tax=unclassified Paenibacillus TaxID=185978 RepID=UPI0030F527D8